MAYRQQHHFRASCLELALTLCSNNLVLQASQGLPNAVTAAEALSDLPRMEIAGAGGQCRRHVGGTWQPHNPAKVGKFVVLHARKGLDATDQGRLLLDHRIVGNSMPDQEAPWNDPLPTITCADDKRLSKMRHPLEARSLTLLGALLSTQLNPALQAQRACALRCPFAAVHVG